MPALVIIPTYNEKENIRDIATALLALPGDFHILVVDDNSPDKTADIVRELSIKNPRVHLLLREKKQGLGRAYIAGFDWGLSRGYSVLVEMDADFSHRPQDLPKLFTAIQSADVAIGSRYVKDGGTVNWGVGRKFISRGGSYYTSMILGYPLRDWTGGFNAWRAEVLQKIGLKSIVSEGYSFQIELKYKALRQGFRVQEIPIIFEDRRVGKSKMSSHIVFEALYRVWKFRWDVTCE